MKHIHAPLRLCYLIVPLVLATALLPTTVLSRAGQRAPTASASPALLDGIATGCDDFYLYLGLFSVDIPDPGWTWVDPGNPIQSITGVAASRSEVSYTDFPVVHDSHDLNVEVLLDPGQEDLLSIVGKDEVPPAGPDTIEVEWEIGTFPSETGSDPERTAPKWGWPSVGDRVWFNGHHIYDCGHTTEVDGIERARSEIHPPRAMAAMRDQMSTLPGTGTTPVRTTTTDLWIHGQAGFVDDVLYCGQSIIVNTSDPNYHCPTSATPIDDDYEFDIQLPPKPFPSAVLATSVDDGPRNTVNVAPELVPMPAADPTHIHVTVPLDGTGATPDDVYSRTITAGWVYPPDTLRHFNLTLNLMDLHEDQDVDPGDCECTFFWMNVDRAPAEWIRLSTYATGNMNDYDDDGGLGDGEMGFSGAVFDYYTDGVMPVTVRAHGWDQDCLDDYFGDHRFRVTIFLDCYLAAAFYGEAGDNDQYSSLAASFGPPGYGVGAQDVTANGEYELEFTIDEIPVDVEDSADLSLTKICKPDDTGLAGQAVTCTIIVDNPGPGLPRNVVVDDTLLTNVAAADYTLSPPTFVFKDASGPPNACEAPTDIPNGKHFICNLGTVPVGGSAIITATFTSSEGGDFNNRALVTTESTDPDMTNNEAVDGLTVLPVADLSVKKDVGAGVDPVTAGTGFAYTIEAKNDGPSAATNVVVTDVVPAGMAVVSAVVPGGSCAAGVPGDPAQPTRCALGALASGETRNVQIGVLVAPDSLGQFNNDAAISSDTLDLDNSDNVATRAITVVASADVSIAKSASPSPNVVAGTALTYTLTVSNAGPSLARNVALTDTLPEGLAFSGFSGGGACSILAPLPGGIVCTFGGIDPGASATAYVGTVVLSSTTGSLSNTAEATSTTPDPLLSNNTSSVDSVILTRADLAIVKTSDQDVYKPSSQVKYTITVTNNGPSDALDVVVTDGLPEMKQAVFNFDTAGCSKTDYSLTCELGTIPSGTSRTFEIYLTIKGSRGEIVNTASVTSSTVDPVPANNLSTRTVLVGK